MKVLVLFTGGTIGCLANDGWLGVNDAAKHVLLQPFLNRADVEFVTLSPYSILSENLSCNELNFLQQTLAEQLQKNYDGIIVTHGTDTLQYTAAALALAFGDAAVPIVLVSAAYPLEDVRSNGFANFEAALAFIESRAANGVFVSYKNDHGHCTHIHSASQLLQHREADANMYSLSGVPFAEYDGEIRVVGAPCIEPSHGLVTYCEQSGVLVVESCPGNAYLYALEDVYAVLLKPYHSATLNTQNEAFKALCKRASENGVPLFVIASDAEVGYESSKAFAELGITVLPHGTFCSAYMKLWAAASLGLPAQSFLKK